MGSVDLLHNFCLHPDCRESGLDVELAWHICRWYSHLGLKGIFCFERTPDVRIVWNVVPDFWSISGSGLILGGAIWVAVAKARITNEPDDLERNGYVLLNGDEQALKESGFELDEISDVVGKHMGMPSNPPLNESRDSQEEVARETEEGITGRSTEFGA